MQKRAYQSLSTPMAGESRRLFLCFLLKIDMLHRCIVHQFSIIDLNCSLIELLAAKKSDKTEVFELS